MQHQRAIGQMGDIGTRVTARYILIQKGPVALAVLAVAAIYTTVERGSGLGPSALIPGSLVTLVVLRTTATWRGHHTLSRTLGFILLGAVSLVQAIVTWFIVGDILETSIRFVDVAPDTGRQFLLDAVLVWLMNILSFALWYWELDGNGPAQRHLHGYQSTDLLFPQVWPPPSPDAGQVWTPHFVDYLFVAFTTSTTFGPGDTAFLSVRGKLLSMAQALTSMAVLFIVVAWAISVL